MKVLQRHLLSKSKTGFDLDKMSNPDASLCVSGVLLSTGQVGGTSDCTMTHAAPPIMDPVHLSVPHRKVDGTLWISAVEPAFQSSITHTHTHPRFYGIWSTGMFSDPDVGFSCFYVFSSHLIHCCEYVVFLSIVVHQGWGVHVQTSMTGL